jgi:hypothetical protein
MPEKTLTVADVDTLNALYDELEHQGESYYFCTTHTDGLHRSQLRFLLAINGKEHFKREFDVHFKGYIKIGKKGTVGHILKSMNGSTLAVVNKISRKKYDDIKSYLEESCLSLLQV